jgi:hypothetical protein
MINIENRFLRVGLSYQIKMYISNLVCTTRFAIIYFRYDACSVLKIVVAIFVDIIFEARDRLVFLIVFLYIHLWITFEFSPFIHTFLNIRLVTYDFKEAYGHGQLRFQHTNGSDTCRYMAPYIRIPSVKGIQNVTG